MLFRSKTHPKTRLWYLFKISKTRIVLVTCCNYREKLKILLALAHTHKVWAFRGMSKQQQQITKNLQNLYSWTQFYQERGNKEQIRNLLPHREPMLLIDELTEIKKLHSAKPNG